MESQLHPENTVAQKRHGAGWRVATNKIKLLQVKNLAGNKMKLLQIK